MAMIQNEVILKTMAEEFWNKMALQNAEAYEFVNGMPKGSFRGLACGSPVFEIEEIPQEDDQ